MDTTQFLSALDRAGVDTQDALNRFMGNESLYLSYLCRLPQAMELSAIQADLNDGQEEAFYAKVHNLKGMAANLSVSSILRPAQLLLEEYRAHGLTQRPRVEALLDEIHAAAAPLTALIQQYQASPAEGGRP